MEPEGSVLQPHVPATCLYPEPALSGYIIATSNSGSTWGRFRLLTYHKAITFLLFMALNRGRQYSVSTQTLWNLLVMCAYVCVHACVCVWKLLTTALQQLIQGLLYWYWSCPPPPRPRSAVVAIYSLASPPQQPQPSPPARESLVTFSCLPPFREWDHDHLYKKLLCRIWRSTVLIRRSIVLISPSVFLT